MDSSYCVKLVDELLINHYLKPKRLGQALTTSPLNISVRDKALYNNSDDPRQILEVDDPSKWRVMKRNGAGNPTEMVTYVFTKLLGKGPRRVGLGSWTQLTKPIEIADENGVVIGLKKFLIYETRRTSLSPDHLNNGGHYKYSMYEYSLPDDHQDIHHYVLCKIHLKID